MTTMDTHLSAIVIKEDFYIAWKGDQNVKLESKKMIVLESAARLSSPAEFSWEETETGLLQEK